MSPRTLAPIAAAVGLVFGGLGLLAPEAMTAAFGISLDRTGTEVARLACASYLGYGALAWLARGVTDAAAWRAIAAGNAVGWGAGAVVVVLAIAGVFGPIAGFDARAWLIVAMQAVFTGLWSLAYVGSARVADRAAASVA